VEELIRKVNDAFRSRWQTEPESTGIAPGRVNIIGEHVDYTGGFVLPAAIDRQVAVAARMTGTGRISACSLDYRQEASCPVGDYDPAHPAAWFRYVQGVLFELEQAGHEVNGCNLAIGGDIPVGRGLASSAALEVAVLTALEPLMGVHMDDRAAALLCQRAESGFVGVNCGVMDQIISRAGRRDHALLIDCTSLEIRPIPAQIPGYTWLTVDSGVSRGLRDSEYNQRRLECQQALAAAQAVFPERRISSLRELDPQDLPALEEACDDMVYRRLRHVVSENRRVLAAAGALEHGDAATIGRLLAASHESLRDDFEVSCRELDTLVETLSDTTGSFGARLIGAGFGGCVLALVQDQALAEVRESVKGKHPRAEPIEVRITDGARVFVAT
jgi:galactokinase